MVYCSRLSFRSLLLRLIFILLFFPEDSAAFIVPREVRSRNVLDSRHLRVANRLAPTSFRLSKQFRAGSWDGDDLRWISRTRRRWLGSFRGLSVYSARNFLVFTTLGLYLYQVFNTVSWIKTLYPEAWPNSAVSIVLDTLLGTSRTGRFTTQNSFFFDTRQPHRYLTSGFLHSSIVHWALNMDALRRLPDWLEELGNPRSFLYLSTFLVAIVCGNLAITTDGLAMGASGGICGLYGLLYVSLARMGNPATAWRVMKGLGLLLLYGCFIPNMSNASHVGGFISGIVVAFVAGPRYRRSYSLRRKNSLEGGDPSTSRAYRTAMGYDRRPTTGFVPLWALWAAIFFLLYQSVPQCRTAVSGALQALLPQNRR